MEAETAGKMGIRAYVGAGIRAGDRMEEKGVFGTLQTDIQSNITLMRKRGFQRIKEAESLVKDYDNTTDVFISCWDRHKP